MLWPLLAVAALLALPAGAAAATEHAGIDYDLDGTPTPTPASLNQLDLYTPNDVDAGAGRPVVVYVHGGGWHRGDKRHAINDKVNLFTGAGYVFASVNYRLSPNPIDPSYPAGRVRFPTQPSDVAEAIGWLDRNVASYGGDPKRILLIGHSAGAQIVALLSTDPSFLAGWGVDPAHVLGTVPLDGDAYDVVERATTGGADIRKLIYNGFATPAENAAEGTWATASAIIHADPADPDELLITQAAAPSRIANAEQMATALGQDPATSVFRAPYDHGGINAAVGSSDDPAGETAAIMRFFASKAPPASRVRVLDRPKPSIKLRHGKRAEVRFRFDAAGAVSSFVCRLDQHSFRRCSSPKRYQVKPGRHKFRVAAIAAGGERGPVRKIGFRVRDRRR